MSHFTHITERLLETGSTVFAGAGLSRSAGIPFANELQSYILGSLGLSEPESWEFLRAGVPFEAFFEVLLSISDCRSLLSVFTMGAPTRNHRLLAKLCGHGHVDTIVTTNFDTLMEDAFDSERIPFRLYVSDDDLGNIDWGGGRPRLIKLHGTIRDPDALAVTIRRVAAQQLVANRRKAIEEIFSSTRVGPCLVFGYSCSDRFDISPTIRKLNRQHCRVVYVSHNAGTLRPSQHRLADTDPTHPFVSLDADILLCSADDLIAALWAYFLHEPPPPLLVSSIEWNAHVDEWLTDVRQQNGDGFTAYVAGLLQKTANKWAESNCHLHAALDKGVPEALRSALHLALGDNHRDMGDIANASMQVQRALAVARALGQQDREAQALNSLGILAEDQKLHDIAIRNYEAALALAETTGNRELQGKCHGNIGIALKNKTGRNNLERAVSRHRRALAIACELGDKRSEGRTLGNLGITYSDLGDKSVAQSYYHNAREIASELGDSLHVGIWLHNAGEDAIGSDDDLAKTLLSEALTIFRALGLDAYGRESEAVLARILAEAPFQTGSETSPNQTAPA